jgi:tetratricopeptide (TPR) repeat protein
MRSPLLSSISPQQPWRFSFWTSAIAMALIAALLPQTFAGTARPNTYEAALITFVERTEGPAGVRRVRKSLDQLAGEQVAAERHAAEPLSADQASAPLRFNRWFFTQANFRGRTTPDDTSQQVVISDAIASRSATCLPLAATYMALAERIEIEATPIATPHHVFIRQKTTGGSLNIELLEGGRQHPDRYYLHQENAPPDDPRADGLLRPLEPGAFLAYLLNNRAVALRAEGRTEEAGEMFREALRLDADCQPCLYNYANLLAGEGKGKKAQKLYDRALVLHPWDEEVERNRALLDESLSRITKIEIR